MKRTSIILLCLLCAKMLSAQTRTIDSLRKRMWYAGTTAEKTQLLVALCAEKYSLPGDSIYKYASQLRSLPAATKGSDLLLLAEYYRAYSYMLNGQEENAMTLCNTYLDQLRREEKRTDLFKLFLQLQGTLYYRTNRTRETLNSYYDLQNIAQQQHDTVNMLIAERGLSLAYLANGQDGEALKIYHTAMQLVKHPVPPALQEIYGLLQVNASIAFLHLHQNTGNMIYADSCQYYGEKAIEWGKITDNLFTQCQGRIVSGVIYSYKKQMQQAGAYLEEGLAIRKIIADTIYMLSDMSVLGSFYANTKQMDKGVAICKTGIELAQKRKMSPALLLLLYNALAENYKANGFYREYGETLKLQMAVKDSLNVKNSSDELKDMGVKYDLQKRENTIIQQKLDITKKNYWLYFSVIFSVMGVAIFLLAFRNYRRRQNVKMQLALAEEKRIAAQSITDAEEQERKRIATDLHDNLGVYAASLSSNINYIQPASLDAMGEAALKELRNNSGAMIAELNDTIWVLKKDALSLTAISDRIKVFINRIARSYPETNIEVRENIIADTKLPSSQAFHLYRLIQEAMNNALKHSTGKNVIVVFNSPVAAQWNVLIQDDGMGMMPGNKASDGGNGLVNMRARAQEAGWQIEWITGRDAKRYDGMAVEGGTAVIIDGTTN